MNTIFSIETSENDDLAIQPHTQNTCMLRHRLAKWLLACPATRDTKCCLMAHFHYLAICCSISRSIEIIAWSSGAPFPGMRKCFSCLNESRPALGPIHYSGSVVGKIPPGGGGFQSPGGKINRRSPSQSAEFKKNWALSPLLLCYLGGARARVCVCVCQNVSDIYQCTFYDVFLVSCTFLKALNIFSVCPVFVLVRIYIW